MNLLECPVCGVGVTPTMSAVEAHSNFHGVELITGILGNSTGPKGIIARVKELEGDNAESERPVSTVAKGHETNEEAKEQARNKYCDVNSRWCCGLPSMCGEL